MEKITKELIDALSSGPVRQYIADHEYDDVRQAVLQNKEILGIPTARLFDQISTRKKAKEKLPLYYNNPAIIYPPPQTFEQSSSEKTAVYKAGIIEPLLPGTNAIAADLTGGFGVDAFFFSRKVQTLYYVEPDVSLMEIARHNHLTLGAANIQYHPVTAEEFVKSTTSSFDFIYADPSRRTHGGKRVHSLEDSQPNVITLAPDIFTKCQLLMIKASPLLDIQAGISQIPFVTRVYVVSINNECREILFLSEKDSQRTPVIEAVNIADAIGPQTFIFTFNEEKQHSIKLSDPLTYLYEPNSSILKAGAFKTIATRFDLKKLQTNTHLYTSDQLIESFPGRKFRVEAIVKPDASELKEFFPSGKANVATRNYPLSPDALKKKTGLQDGGEKFLLAFSGVKRKFIAVATRL